MFLSPDSLLNGIGEIIATKVQLRSHFRWHDSLIQPMALALKTELEIADKGLLQQAKLDCVKEKARSEAMPLGLSLLNHC